MPCAVNSFLYSSVFGCYDKTLKISIGNRGKKKVILDHVMEYSFTLCEDCHCDCPLASQRFSDLLSSRWTLYRCLLPGWLLFLFPYSVAGFCFEKKSFKFDND